MRFLSAAGLQLSGRLDYPAGEKYHSMVLFAHCFTCTKNVNSAAHISKFLTGRGFAVFRFDFTGLGASQGDFSDTNFATNVEDIVYASKFLSDNYQAPKVLIGHSLGGTAVLQAAAKIRSAKAVVTIGSPADPRHVLTHLSGATSVIRSEGEAVVNLAGRPFLIKKQFLEDLETRDLGPVLKKMTQAILIMHSPIDDTVGIEHAGALFKTARHPKSFISLDHADHLLSQKSDAQYAASIIAAWVQRYL